MDAKVILGECRTELSKLVRTRGKEEIRILLVKLIEMLEPGKGLSEVSLDQKILVVRLFRALRCQRLATAEGMEYIRIVSLDDLERLP